MGSKVRTQPLQSKEIKISSTVLIHKIYQRAIKPPKDFIKFSSQVPLFNGHAALQGPSPDSKHKDLIFTFFCNRGNSMSFGSKLANSPQTGTQAKESKNKLKITGKNVANFSESMGSLQTWSSNEFFSAAVLKQRKRASVKNSNTEAGPVPFALF